MKKIFSVVFFTLFITNQTVFAASLGGMDPGVINTQYMREFKTFEAKSKMQQKNAIINSTKDENPANDAIPIGNLKKIQFVNNNNFSAAQLSSIVEDKINQPMTAENLSEIRKRIMRFYQSEGFFSAVPVIISQDNKTGEIVIEIKEGTKNSIIVE